MELKQATAFVMSLKGAALSCLFLMYAMRDERRNWTRNDLADLTGWSRERVSTGLRRLKVHELVLQQNRYNWQLTDMGYQLALEERGVSLNDSVVGGVSLNDSVGGVSLNDSGVGGVSLNDSGVGGVSLNDSGGVSLNDSVVVVLKSHDHEPLNLHEQQQQPPAGVSLNDSPESADPIFWELVQQLVRCGAAPEKAQEAIDQAWTAEVSNLEIELRILWWRAYCGSTKGIGNRGALIAARVAEGIDKPKDFQLRDIPERHAELRQDIEDLERLIESASDQAVTQWLHAPQAQPKK